MNPVQVESLTFDFDASVNADKYDDWQHVNRDWASRIGMKKMDLVAVEPIPAVQTLWMIEAKDFRIVTDPPRPSNLSGLPGTVADKAEHTILGLADTANNALRSNERQLASQAQACKTIRIVLHLEPHLASGTQSALFPTNFASSVYQQMKQLVSHIDANPLVLDLASTPEAKVPWRVA